MGMEQGRENIYTELPDNRIQTFNPHDAAILFTMKKIFLIGKKFMTGKPQFKKALNNPFHTCSYNISASQE